MDIETPASESGVETNIEVQLTGRERFTALIRFFVALPMILWADTISGAIFSSRSGSLSYYAALIGSTFFIPLLLSLLVRNKYPSYFLSFNHSMMELSTRINAYLFLLTDKYPTLEANETVSVLFPDVEGGAKLNRFMPLIKWFLAIPLYVVAAFYYIGGFFMAIYGWLSIIFTGSLPESVARYGVNLISFTNSISGYAFVLVTDKYPSFALGE